MSFAPFMSSADWARYSGSAVVSNDRDEARTAEILAPATHPLDCRCWPCIRDEYEAQR